MSVRRDSQPVNVDYTGRPAVEIIATHPAPTAMLAWLFGFYRRWASSGWGSEWWSRFCPQRGRHVRRWWPDQCTCSLENLDGQGLPPGQQTPAGKQPKRQEVGTTAPTERWEWRRNEDNANQYISSFFSLDFANQVVQQIDDIKQADNHDVTFAFNSSIKCVGCIFCVNLPK